MSVLLLPLTNPASEADCAARAFSRSMSRSTPWCMRWRTTKPITITPNGCVEARGGRPHLALRALVVMHLHDDEAGAHRSGAKEGVRFPHHTSFWCAAASKLCVRPCASGPLGCTVIVVAEDMQRDTLTLMLLNS